MGAVRHLVLRDGRRVLLRPLRPEDAALYPDCLDEITPDDLRLRYFAVMRELSPALIDKHVHYDPSHAMASIAIDEANGKMLGVVRLHNDPGDETGEFAIIVRSPLKGHGLGWLMMKHMIAYAKDRGMKTVRGEVLAENTTMLQMCAELGFHASDDPQERGIKMVTLPLDEVKDGDLI